MKMLVSLLCVMLALPQAKAGSIAQVGQNTSVGYGWSLGYDWFNQVINQAPTHDGVCPTLSVDEPSNSYKVSAARSFSASVSASISQWFPAAQVWASFAIGPMINKFGIVMSNVSSPDEAEDAKYKKLPLKVSEINKWNVHDSAYWESQGGVAFYLGAGYDPVSVSAYAVASGGWANYLEKTGPTSVYVERSKKYVKSVSLGVGVFYAGAGADFAVSKANGFNYEFNLNNSANAEAYERFMAGDSTRAFELSKIPNSGVKKIADTSSTSFARSFGANITSPILPIISFKVSTGKDYDHEEELSIWDEHVVKNYGVYSRQSASRLVGLHVKKGTSFKGGSVLLETGADDAKTSSFKYYGNFKHAYQSDWGQEGRLGRQIDYAKDISGFSDNDPVTCVNVPSLRHSLGYNQVVMQMNLSDEYMREILGIGKGGSRFLADLESRAAYLDSNARQLAECSTTYDPNQKDSADAPACRTSSVSWAFKSIRNAVAKINASVGKDQNGFALGMANLGKAIWSNPSVFHAVYEKGKDCGMDFNFEVSGQRISRFYKQQKYMYSNSCAN